jgi:hypothetical protein
MYTAQAATTSPPSEDDFSISGSYVISHLLALDSRYREVGPCAVFRY